MMKKSTFSLLWVALFLSSMTVSAQNSVIIDQTTQRFIGEASELDRTKYFNLHSGSTSDVDIAPFAEEYNVTFGRQFWGPFSASSHPNRPNEFPDYTAGTTNTSIRSTHQMVATEHPGSVARYNVDPVEAANWAAEYYLDVASGSRPEYYEPMNEPFVHAGDGVFAEQQSDQALMREHMAAYFREIGKAFDESPQLANMKVIGYSSAWPSMELWDFGHWNTRMKMFMDTAGPYMDAIATHLYDGINVTGTGGRRSGSNGEAILDLIETYSYSKWGSIKPHAITEYGNIEAGYPDGYSHAKSAQSMRSINHFLFNLLDRDDRLEISIPFIVDKATWWFNADRNWEPYVPALFIPETLGSPPNSDWQYSSKINFYKLWQNVEGKRVFIYSDNPDIQSHAFVNDTKLYVALSNLDDSLQTVDLEFLAGMEGLQNVNTRALKIYTWEDPLYTDTDDTEAPESISLIGDETVVLEYTFDQAIIFSDSISEKSYYTEKHLQSINGEEISFNFDGVEVGSGIATLKMGLGRALDASKTPILKVNGKQVLVPSNWKGNDQSARDGFFGVLDIPIPMEFLQESNVISVKFPDTGGRISTMILNVSIFNNERALEQYPLFNWPIVITDTIEAEYFDIGDEGFAYSDADAENTGGAYRETGVDLSELASGATVLSSTETDEWIEYTVLVPENLTYRLISTVASDAGGSFRLDFDSEDKTGVISIDATGGNEIFAQVMTDVELEKGTYTMRLVVLEGGFNLDKMTFDIPVDSVVLSEEEITYDIGRRKTLRYEVYPEIASNQNISWHSVDELIATVSEAGRVEMISDGTTWVVITTEDGAKTDSCIVNVNPGISGINNSLENSAILYPNPYEEGTLWLDLKKIDDEIRISIVSFDGKLIYQTEKMGGTKISLDLGDQLSKGLYLVQISHDNETTTKKLIVK